MATCEKRSLDDTVYSAKHILLDIEGTTTSISFVKETLFPYVRKNLESYISDHWDEEELKKVLSLLKEQAVEDKKAELDGVVDIPAEGSDDDIKSAVIKSVLWQMDADRKTTALKQLQGHMWRQGYKTGDLKGHLYSDVAPALREWSKDGRKLYVYSSGSVEAQKLLFGHSVDGDLTELFTDYFDTEVGAKVDVESYKTIVKKLDCNADDVLFLTDMPKEASAARLAGLPVVLVEREGNEALSSDEHKEYCAVSSFQDLTFETSNKKLKTDDSSNQTTGKNGNVVEAEKNDVEMKQEEPVIKEAETKETEKLSDKAKDEESKTEVKRETSPKEDEAMEVDKVVDTESTAKQTPSNNLDAKSEETSLEVEAKDTATEKEVGKSKEEVTGKQSDAKSEENVDSDKSETKSEGKEESSKSEPKEKVAQVHADKEKKEEKAMADQEMKDVAKIDADAGNKPSQAKSSIIDNGINEKDKSEVEPEDGKSEQDKPAVEKEKPEEKLDAEKHENESSGKSEEKVAEEKSERVNPEVKVVETVQEKTEANDAVKVEAKSETDKIEKSEKTEVSKSEEVEVGSTEIKTAEKSEKVVEAELESKTEERAEPKEKTDEKLPETETKSAESADNIAAEKEISSEKVGDSPAEKEVSSEKTNGVSNGTNGTDGTNGTNGTTEANGTNGTHGTKETNGTNGTVENGHETVEAKEDVPDVIVAKSAPPVDAPAPEAEVAVEA